MNGARLHLDFETRSLLDLTKVGLHVYADPSKTEVMCVAWAFDEESVHVASANPEFATNWWQRVLDHVKNGGEVIAHNAAFEFEIWNKVFCPAIPLKLEQMTCTMAMSYAMGLPGTLEKCAAALGIDQQKDMEGSRLMKQMCKPRDIDLVSGNITWWDEPEKLDRLKKYCAQDVLVEREVEKRMFKLSSYEQKVWRLDQQINARGIAVDKLAVENAYKLVELAKANLDVEMRRVTDNNVATVGAVQQLKDHLEFFGVSEESLSKPDVQGLLADPKLHPHARKVLEIRAQGGKAATAKLEPILTSISADNRVRGCFQYSGAGTRRWSGRRIQLQNLKRPSLKHKTIEEIVDAIRNGIQLDMLDLNYGSALSIIGDCTRAFLTAAHNSTLITSDFNAIEARVLAWLAGQDNVLDIFRSGQDIYLVQASDIFSSRITDKDDSRRQVGKVAILALGYQGGVGAFQTMAKAYGVKMAPVFPELWEKANPEIREQTLNWYKQAGGKYEISKEEFIASDITKIKWREANRQIVGYWTEVERASIHAVAEEGKTFTAGNGHRAVKFRKKGSFLWCQLPGSGVICYPYPELKETKTPWGTLKQSLTYMAEDGQSKKWQRYHTYGGSIAENLTQSVARDLLADAMLRLDSEGYKIVAHVHDEIIVESSSMLRNLDRMNEIMQTNPAWAHDLPITANGWTGFRYRK